MIVHIKDSVFPFSELFQVWSEPSALFSWIRYHFIVTIVLVDKIMNINMTLTVTVDTIIDMS